MTRNLSIMMAAALALGSTVAVAEEHEKNLSTQGQSSAVGTSSTEQMQLLDGSVISDAKITDKQGNHLGKIERLLFDKESGMVRFAVLQVDKAWSLNNPEVIVPFKVLEINREDARKYTITVDTDKDKLQQAPKFEEPLLNQLTTSAGAEAIYQHWGMSSSEVQSSSSSTVSSPSSTQPTDANSAGATSTSPTTSSDGSTTGRSVGTSGTTDSNPANSDATSTTPSSSTQPGSSTAPSGTSTQPDSSTSPTGPDASTSSDLIPPLPEPDPRALGEDQSD
jgi:sporulation protein YlmC with PRC-barrel domain